MENLNLIIGGSFIALGSIFTYVNHFVQCTFKNYQNHLETNLQVIDQNTNINDIKENQPILLSDKIVVVEPAFDNEMGITFHSPRVKRIVWTYQKQKKQANRKTGKVGWKREVEDKQTDELAWQEALLGNIDQLPLSSKTFFASKVMCGPLEIVQEVLNKYFKAESKFMLSRELCINTPIPWLKTIDSENQNSEISAANTNGTWKNKFKNIENGNLYIVQESNCLEGDIKYNMMYAIFKKLHFWVLQMEKIQFLIIMKKFLLLCFDIENFLKPRCSNNLIKRFKN